MSSAARLARALAGPFLVIGTRYNDVAKKYPQATAVITTTIKTSAADAFAQLVIEGRHDLDLRRHAAFVGFGFAYLGYWQYYLYNTLFARWCKSITAVVGHMGSAPVKTFLDQAIHHPLMYFPCFYMVKGAMQQQGPVESLRRCYDEMWENLKALWAVWVPAQLINFSLVPMHLRIPFVAAVSFLWTVIISNLRGQMEEAPARSSSSGGSTTAAALKAATSAQDLGMQQAGAAAAAAAMAAATGHSVPAGLRRTPPPGG